MGPIGERGGQPGQAAPPPSESELDKGRGTTPPFPTPSPFPFLSLSPSWWNPTRTWSPSRTPLLGRAPYGRPTSFLPPLYTWGGGTLEYTQVDLLAVCGAPLHRNTPRSYRRS